MKKIILLLMLLPSLSYGAPVSKMYSGLIGVVNSLKASSSRARIPGYPLSESPGYYHFSYEDIGESKESLQKLLREGHKYKNRYNRVHNSIPGYPASEMGKVKMTVSDLLGDYYYSDEQFARLAKNLGYKGKLYSDDYLVSNDAYEFIFSDERVLNLASFRKVVKTLEPDVSLDIFK
jgi:hypothetical protein